jgi:hypothetical protein
MGSLSRKASPFLRKIQKALQKKACFVITDTKKITDTTRVHGDDLLPDACPADRSWTFFLRPSCLGT